MSITETIRSDLKRALKNKEAARLSTLRMLLSALNYAKIDKQGDLTEEDEVRVLMSEAKKRKEAIDSYQQAGREDRAADETTELAIIEEYTPSFANDEDIAALISDVVASQSQASQQVGPMVGMVIKEAKNRGMLVDGGRVKGLVEEALKRG